MKRLLAAIAALVCLGGSAAAEWPPTPWSAASSAAGTSTVNPAVVRIIAPGRDSVSLGSGTLVAKSREHGLIITNWHVVNEATGQIVVKFPDGFTSAGTVIKIDRDWDLAAIAIWRPNAEPVPLATTAPQPGETLTIAGYGPGNYRAVSGQCTQYVAPGNNFPFEMVELATTARQGDSGGPILNTRGELAGVLFGEGQGRTAGSYCGRVQWFLTGLLPAQSTGNPNTMLASNSSSPRSAANPYAPPGHSGARVGSLAALGTTAGAAPQNATPPAPLGPPTSLASAGSRRSGYQPVQDDSGWQSAPRGLANPSRDHPAGSRDDRDPEMTNVPAMRAIPDTASMTQSSERAFPASSRSEAIDSSTPHRTIPIHWSDIAGNTIGEQCKTVLATVGGLAIVLHALSWMSSGSSSAGDEAEDEDDDDDDDDDEDEDDDDD